MITSTMTVEEWLVDELCLRGLRMGECERALDFARSKMSEIFLNQGHLETKQGGGVLFKDCWKTNANDYTQEALERLRGLIEHHTFTWLVNQLRSRS